MNACTECEAHMKRLLQKIIRECDECPHLEWEENISCSNDSGVIVSYVGKK